MLLHNTLISLQPQLTMSEPVAADESPAQLLLDQFQMPPKPNPMFTKPPPMVDNIFRARSLRMCARRALRSYKPPISLFDDQIRFLLGEIDINISQAFAQVDSDVDPKEAELYEALMSKINMGIREKQEHVAMIKQWSRVCEMQIRTIRDQRLSRQHLTEPGIPGNVAILPSSVQIIEMGF